MTRPAWAQHGGASRAWMALALYNLTVGALMLGSGPERWSGASWILVRDWGGPAWWGTAFAAVGIAIAFGGSGNGRRLPMILLIAAVAHVWLATQLFAAAVIVPDGGLLGGPTFLIIAFWHVSVASVVRDTVTR